MPTPQEIENRYLLRTLPQGLDECRSVSIQQGYISPFHDADIIEICRRERLTFCSDVTLRRLRDLVRTTPNKGFRVRKMGEQYFLTFKGRSDAGYVGSKRVEIETAEDSSERVEKFIFDAYYPQSKKIEKVRYYLPLADGLTAEVDVFGGSFAGLAFVEVEFDSVTAGRQFTPPDFFGTLTRVSNRDLAYGKVNPDF